MKTIGAKELRLNLDAVLDRVIGGEDVIVQHRFKDPVLISSYAYKSEKKRGRLAGLKAFEAAEKTPSPFDPNRSIKDLYDESISAQYLSH